MPFTNTLSTNVSNTPEFPGSHTYRHFAQSLNPSANKSSRALLFKKVHGLYLSLCFEIYLQYSFTTAHFCHEIKHKKGIFNFLFHSYDFFFQQMWVYILSFCFFEEFTISQFWIYLQIMTFFLELWVYISQFE